ncbi:LexA family protein [Fusobacterium nucleatum]|mgnify:FL=1|uniref:LexA family protein n=1 Tax=Fusobacterium nucleatum TaxID=851 RepID=UPI00235DCE8D|nr:XRE family transcriptional regulator [Fusobacterium nucleatum]WDA46792.1 XRE family transcriptional regulator [Fusobacterium nucleatum]
MLDVGKMIKELRIKKNISQEDLANILSVNRATIANYESGRRALTIDKLEELLNALDTSLADFFNSNNLEKTEVKPQELKKIPILSDVSAGYGKEALEDATHWIKLPTSIARNATFGTFVAGDSMEPKINDGDLLLVQDTPQLDSGEIGVFLLNEKVYCKRFHYNPITKELVLKSLNTNYKPMYISRDDDFRIIGKVVGIYDYTV